MAPVLLALELVACTSWRVQGPTPEAAIIQRKPAVARVTRTDGTRVILHRPLVEGGGLRGELSSRAKGDTVLIPLGEVDAVATRRFDIWKSIGLYFAVGLAVAPVFWRWP